MDSKYRILGTLEVLQGDVPIDLGSPRQRALLARFLISAGEMVTTDRLVEDLWPTDPPETARHSLHVYVSRLRKALGPDDGRLASEGSGYRFSVDTDELDAARFEHLVAEGRAARGLGDAAMASSLLHEALGLWRGHALVDVCDEPFARTEAVRLEELRLDALEVRTWADLELGAGGELVEGLEELVVQHPYRETFWEQLMLALYRSGRQAEALRVFQRARGILAEELGIEPGPALRQMEERVLGQDPTLGAEAPGRAATPSNTLPVQRTGFIGRERELALGAELLDRSRLLTLTGPPGSGKTRLALRLASDNRHRFEHGVYFVPLAAAGSSQSFDDELARALGLADVPGKTVGEGIDAFLRDREAVLVLDNFEQLIDAAPRVGKLLDAASGIRLIVTSRMPLVLSGEQALPVPPLSTPLLDGPLDPDEVSAYDAVALFVARARAADPDFVLSSLNAAAVAEITDRLDGLPLAIELAAARINVLTPEALLTRLEQRLSVLTGGPVDVGQRHRTMRDAIAWSYELLDPVEQSLFRRLGVFRGGFTLDAATAVAEVEGTSILDGVGQLLSKGLVYRPVDTGPARYAYLETIREYALEQLELAEERADTMGRHAHYFLGLAREIEPQLTHEPQGTGLDRLSSERENLLAVLDWSAETDRPDVGLELGGLIWRYWHGTGQLEEGIRWLERLLDHPAASMDARAKGLTALAGLAYWQTDYEQAQASYSKALEAYRALGDRYNEADTLYAMSMTASFVGDLTAAELLADAAKSMFQEMGDREGVGRVLLAQAQMHWLVRGDLEKARALWEESLAISLDVGSTAVAASQLFGLAGIQFAQGERDAAVRTAFDALRMSTAAHSVPMTVLALESISVSAASRAPHAAVRLAAAASSHRRTAGGFTLDQVAGIPTARDQVAVLLDEDAIELAWSEGAGMSLEEAVEQALGLEHQLLNGGDMATIEG